MLPQLVLLCIALPPVAVFAIKQMAGDQLEQRLDENFLCTNVILTLCGYVPGMCMGAAQGMETCTCHWQHPQLQTAAARFRIHLPSA